MFESGIHSVSSIALTKAGFRTAVTLYDLIPHIYPHIYLDTEQAKTEYGEKFEHLRRADLLLAISESSRQEGLDRLGLMPSQVVNISSAADEHFTAAAVDAGREAALRGRHALARPFAMYTGGIDHRKNIEGLIRAWAALPASVLAAHQLAIVCAVRDSDRKTLEQLMQDHGLASGSVVLTGFVAEEDLVDLYRLCKLFVFPSRHEGFGLPALEAMRCGAPTIGAHNSSIPEVIGHADALFDAGSDASITAKILQYLQDDALRDGLARHGRQQAERFSWDASARTALAALEKLAPPPRMQPAAVTAKPRMAFVSPMPPQRSGIADFSAQLLPELARHYDIDLVLEQPTLEAMPAGSFTAQRSADWFLEHGHSYDRILYQFGNSAYHQYMFPLLERHPGVVVLHDFYLSGLVAHREVHSEGQPFWSRALYESHGWPALAERFRREPADVVFAYPANFEVLRQALGVIVHSRHALRLANQWYGPDASENWALVPLLRAPPRAIEREAARARLGLAPEDFVVCSFGLLGPTKLNHRLLQAWRDSALATAPACQLLFVGEPQQSPYGKAFGQQLQSAPGNVRVTGWTDSATYSDYLAAADMAVQLRGLSRGETSAAVLDCMNHGLPTIANREGSMADLDPEAVCLLPQEFTDAQLTLALESLWRHPERRAQMQERSRGIVHTQHAPAACAAAYAQAIEKFSQLAAAGRRSLVSALAEAMPADAGDALFAGLARAIAHNMPEGRPARQLLVDTTGHRLGAPHELPALLRGLMDKALPGWRVEPVYERHPGEWRYARSDMLRQLSCPGGLLADDPIDVRRDDLWLVPTQADAAPAPLPPQADALGLAALHLPREGDPALAWAVLAAIATTGGQRQWFIDISELVQRDSRSGIQRVVKNYLMALLLNPPPDVCVVPVYATKEEPGYRVAQRYALQLAGIESARPQGDRIEPRAGDLFFGLDLQPHIVPAQSSYVAALRSQGVKTGFMVYDLLPIQLPECFVDSGARDHARWLEVVAQADFAICISQAIADELAAWLQHPSRKTAQGMPHISAVHLGADLRRALSSSGLPFDAAEQLAQIRERPSFLMVGTIEPRKSHAQVLDAFEQLWTMGQDVQLCIVGRPGWRVEPLIERLRHHPQRDVRLFWVEDASDEYLEQLYGACICLVLASQGEGFGLPLIEAAQHGMALVARDLPVFREVAGDHAFYFQDDRADALAGALKGWLTLYRQGQHPRSLGMPWQTWAQSAEQLKRQLLDQAPQGPGGPAP